MEKKQLWKICKKLKVKGKNLTTILILYNINMDVLTLEQVLNSYNILITFLLIFIVLVIILFLVNPNGFNKSFGTEIFVTGPILLLLTFLIKDFVTFKENPSDSIIGKLSISSKPWFPYAIMALIVAIGLGGFFSVLAVGGIFSDKPPENNTAMILNFVIIIFFLLLGYFMYSRSSKQDETYLAKLPKDIQNLFALRTRYTIMFVCFLVFMAILYFVNPWSIMTDYGGPIMFFTMFVGIIMVIMITIYQYYFANPSKANMFKDSPGFMSYFLKGSYVIGALGLSAGLIYGALKLMGVFNQDASQPGSWGHIIFNLILFCAMLSIIYKLANAGGFLDQNPYYRLILNTLLYIPCLLVTVVSFISKLFGYGVEGASKPTPFEYKILAFSVFLLGGYFLWFFLLKPLLKTKYLKQGGQQLVNQPIQTDSLTNITSYQQLSEIDKMNSQYLANTSAYQTTDTGVKFNYEYAMSFWFYIDSFPPSTSSAYMKVVPILSYAENPTIKYSSADNTLYITVKQKVDGNPVVTYIQEQEMEIKPETVAKWQNIQEKIHDTIEKVKSMPFGNDVDSDGHRIIYKHPNVLLQKWNNIVLNYNGGTLDVFYNGKLVKSAIEVVPYMKLDMLTVGTENGISGNVANLIYFSNPLDLPTINTLYNSLKDQNPPSIPENHEKLIPLPNK